jgi:DnaJ-class molecular chaperone
MSEPDDDSIDLLDNECTHCHGTGWEDEDNPNSLPCDHCHGTGFEPMDDLGDDEEPT